MKETTSGMLETDESRDGGNPLVLLAKRFKKEIFLFLLVCLIVYRAPYLLYAPRFFAEEGAVYFPFAYNSPWYHALFMVPLGYFSLLNNTICLIAAKVLPLEYAPFFTTYVSLLILLIPFILVLYGRSVLFDTFPKKVLVCLSILFLTTGVLWLNIITCQFYLCLSVFLIVVQDVSVFVGFRKWAARFLLVISGLTGTISCFLIPVYFLRHWKRKQRETRIQLLILLGCALIHAALFVLLMYMGAYKNRMASSHSLFNTLKVFFTLNFLYPIAGQTLLMKASKVLTHAPGADLIHLSWYVFLTVYGCGLLFVLATGLKKHEQRLALLSLFLLSVLLTVFSWNMAGGLRYAYVPNVLLLILLISCTGFGRKSRLDLFRNIAAVLLVSFSLFTGVLEYKPRLKPSVDPSWPKWRDELDTWRKNPNYRIKIWPRYQIDWRMKLVERETRPR